MLDFALPWVQVNNFSFTLLNKKLNSRIPYDANSYRPHQKVFEELKRFEDDFKITLKNLNTLVYTWILWFLVIKSRHLRLLLESYQKSELKQYFNSFNINTQIFRMICPMLLIADHWTICKIYTILKITFHITYF
jgi:hypothetical protein